MYPTEQPTDRPTNQRFSFRYRIQELFFTVLILSMSQEKVSAHLHHPKTQVRAIENSTTDRLFQKIVFFSKKNVALLVIGR